MNHDWFVHNETPYPTPCPLTAEDFNRMLEMIYKYGTNPDVAY